MLLELLQGAQTNHRTTAEPERGHGSELLMQTDEELVETAPANDVLQVPIPGRRGTQHCRTYTILHCLYWDIVFS